MKYTFIFSDLARACTVRMACRLLKVGSSGYCRFLKVLVRSRRFRRLEGAMLVSFEWIEVWYRRTKIHDPRGYQCPEAFGEVAIAGTDPDGNNGTFGSPVSSGLSRYQEHRVSRYHHGTGRSR